MALGRQVIGRQVEVQASDEAHDNPHHDARFGAEQEGIGQPKYLVGQHASAQAENQSLDPLVRYPGVSAPRSAGKGGQQGDVGDEAGDAQVNGDLEEFVVGVGDDAATVAILRQSGVQLVATVESHRSGKMYASQYDEHDYFGEILSVIRSIYVQGTPVVVLGPGFTKDHFVKYGKEKEPQVFAKCVLYTTGHAGMNGVQEAIKLGIAERITKDNRVSFETQLVEKLFEEIQKDGLATYGEQQVSNALDRGAVVHFLVSDVIIRSKTGEQLLHRARQIQSKFTIINSLHEAGKKFEGIGGIAAFLRYKL